MSKDKIATQSSTAPSITDVSAGKAVDRDTDTCMKTNIIDKNSPENTVWWEVDLGDVFSIYSVSIMFKNYNGEGRYMYYIMLKFIDNCLYSGSRILVECTVKIIDNIKIFFNKDHTDNGGLYMY